MQLTLKTIPLSKIRPNPFRQIDKYPIIQKKLDALEHSLEATGWWSNVVARQMDGHVEIAYGHHRWRALTNKYGPRKSIDLLVGDISDEQMLKMMADENLEEWGHLFVIELETVRSTVQAFADGKIRLKQPAKETSKNQLRYAPGFVQGDARDGPPAPSYNGETVAAFLGWEYTRVKRCLQAAELIEVGALDEKELHSHRTDQARGVINSASKEYKAHMLQAKQAEREAKDATDQKKKKRLQQKAEKAKRAAVTEGQRVSGAVSTELKSGKIGSKKAAHSAAKHSRRKDKKALPNVDSFCVMLANKIGKMFAKDEPLHSKIMTLVANKKDCTKKQLFQVESALRKLAARLVALADKLKKE